jgi:phage shock protein A
MYDRLKTVISSNINSLISKAEDPEKMLNQMIIDMNEQLIESKKSVAMAIADEKKLERDMIENRAKADEWKRKASSPCVPDATISPRKRFLRKQEFEGYALSLHQQWEAQKQSVENSKMPCASCSPKIEEANRKKNILIARAKRAEARRHQSDHVDCPKQERL